MISSSTENITEMAEKCRLLIRRVSTNYRSCLVLPVYHATELTNDREPKIFVVFRHKSSSDNGQRIDLSVPCIFAPVESGERCCGCSLSRLGFVNFNDFGLSYCVQDWRPIFLAVNGIRSGTCQQAARIIAVWGISSNILEKSSTVYNVNVNLVSK